ncbi:hypothetical protein [Roseovarius sp. M141]|uniref:hypothetical protein n=1 Tax=Roseovarius sp. M141 TaxID=2583806 RepID=UPI0020CC051A|nr:hypothetical protein [Roseovarius sp. M141]
MVRRAFMLRAALVAALILPLAACLGGEGATGLAAKAGGGQRSAAFYGGDVIVTGPPGYCVDPNSVQRRADSGFALMASCGHLSTAPSGYVPAAVITASVLPRDASASIPTAARLAGPWVDAGVAQQIDTDDIALIQVARGGDSLLPSGDPRHWRGAMLIGGHLIGLAVYGDAGADVSGNAGRALLTDTAAAMLAASPVRAPK